MSKFYKLKVKEIIRETPSSVIVEFEVPEKLKPVFQFVPGQYITIQKELGGENLHRAYSICSSVNSGELMVAIKEVEHGKFSVYANRVLQTGDFLELTIPEGKFVLDTHSGNQNNYLAFAAGSGITPVFSMIKSVLEIEKDSEFVLVYGNRSKEETIFKAEIDQLAKDHKDRFKVYYAYSREENERAYTGRINTEIIQDIIKEKYDQVHFDAYYICGPEAMIDLIEDVLSDHKVDKDLIKFELFTTTTKKNKIDSNLDGKTNITILLDEEETTYEMDQKDLILNTALSQGLDAPYSCQGGICSSCLARVVEGNAVMEKNTILNEEEVAEGLILTCQAHPTTSTIKIDFDDV